MGTKIEVTAQVTAGGHVRVGDVQLPVRFELHWTFTDEAYGQPELHAVIEVIDGVPQCREFKVVSPPGGRQLISSDFRDIRIDDLVEQAAAQIAHPIGEVRADGTVFTRVSARPEDFHRARKAVQRARMDGRKRGPSDAELAEAAEVYRANPDAPTKAVAEHFELAHRTASLWIKRARDKGLMGAALLGKAGER